MRFIVSTMRLTYLLEVEKSSMVDPDTKEVQLLFKDDPLTETTIEHAFYDALKEFGINERYLEQCRGSHEKEKVCGRSSRRVNSLVYGALKLWGLRP